MMNLRKDSVLVMHAQPCPPVALVMAGDALSASTVCQDVSTQFRCVTRAARDVGMARE